MEMFLLLFQEGEMNLALEHHFKEGVGYGDLICQRRAKK